MRRVVIAFAFLTYLGILGCVTHPKLAEKPKVNPANVAFAVIGEFECGEFQGFVVVTADGKITTVPDNDATDIPGVAALVPEHSAVVVDLSANCPPKIKT